MKHHAKGYSITYKHKLAYSFCFFGTFLFTLVAGLVTLPDQAAAARQEVNLRMEYRFPNAREAGYIFNADPRCCNYGDPDARGFGYAALQGIYNPGYSPSGVPGGIDLVNEPFGEINNPIGWPTLQPGNSWDAAPVPNVFPFPLIMNFPFINRTTIRYYVASSQFDIPDCAANAQIKFTGPNGDADALRITYRGASNTGSWGPGGTRDYPETRADILLGTSASTFSRGMFNQDLGLDLPPPGLDNQTVTLTDANISITPQQLREGVTVIYRMETQDYFSNGARTGPFVGPWRLWEGKQFSFSKSGHPYIRVTYDDATCPKFDVEPDIPVIDSSTGVVSFDATNNGRGESRHSGNEGVLFAASVWVNGNPVLGPESLVLPRAIIAPNGGKWSATRGGAYTYSVGSLSPGDEICALLRVDPSAGFTGGAITNRERFSSNGIRTCITYFARPYFRVYGGDVVVGRGFEPNCSGNPGAQIRSFTLSGPAWRGSGAQFAVSATGTIEGFLSASMRNNVPGTNPPNDLSFGNFDGSTKVSQSGRDVGAYQGCIFDYYQWAAQDQQASLRSEDLNSQIGSNALARDINDAIHYYVGDLRITANQTFEEERWTAPSQVEHPMIIVRGNILIDPGVTQLDGSYIAQPDPSRDPTTDPTGIINTCSTPQVGLCRNQLVVNGSFTAQRLLLNRINGDLRGASPNEMPNANIAEVFNFPPHLLLSPITTRPELIQAPNKARSIVGLPPIL